MGTNGKRLTLKPTWTIVVGVILVFISYLLDNSVSLIRTVLQVAGIMLVIFGIVLWSARSNAKPKV